MTKTDSNTQALRTRDGFDLRSEIVRLLGERETGTSPQGAVECRIRRLLTHAIRDNSGELPSIWHDIKAADLAQGLTVSNFQESWPFIATFLRR